MSILRINLAQTRLHMINSLFYFIRNKRILSGDAKIKEKDFPQKAPSAMYLRSSCTPRFVKSGVRLGREKGK